MSVESILNGVEDTLYIPLVGRIYATKKFPEFFYDEKALSLESHIPTDSIDKNSNEYFYMASVCRQQTIDEKIISFLKDNTDGNVVFLGAGLETAYHRIGNKTANFYQVDLPSVIEIRKRVLGNGNNENFISGDMFRLDWIKEIDTTLPTLIMDLITRKDVKEYVEKLSGINLKILLPSGEFLQDEGGNDVLAAKIIADYLKDPYTEPEFTPGKTPYWKIELDMPKSLKVLPNRLSYSHDFMFSIFPTWGDYALTAVHRDYEVYHGQGLTLRQVARRRKPVTKGALMNWLAISANLSDENAEDVIIATHKAWERGLLLPGIADISYLDWSGGTLSNLASMAISMESMAKDGMLSLIWEAACDTIKVSLEAPRMLAGTAEIAKLLRDYLDEVIFAVENKLAPKSILKMKAIKTLASKSGASKAVSYAKEIANKLKTFDTEAIKEADKSEKTSDVKVSPNDFDEVWLRLPKPKALINDNVSMNVKALELRKNEKVFQFNLKLPDIPEYEYQVTIAGWLYGLINEGQVSAFEADNNGKIINEDEKAVWLHYDSVKEKIVLSKFRNWRDEENGPLKGETAPYSKVLLTMAVALLAQDGESIYGAKSLFKQLVKSGELNVDTLRDITRELLRHEDISPAKLVRVVEKERELLSVFRVMLSECIVAAGVETLKNNKPPVWINRILDICTYYADYLREAAYRGLISAEDAKWQGLLEIAQNSAKSTAVKKAKSLVEKLGIAGQNSRTE